MTPPPPRASHVPLYLTTPFLVWPRPFLHHVLAGYNLRESGFLFSFGFTEATPPLLSHAPPLHAMPKDGWHFLPVITRGGRVT